MFQVIPHNPILYYDEGEGFTVHFYLAVAILFSILFLLSEHGVLKHDEITINFADTNAVCFSKDGSYFSDSGILSPLIICLRRITIPKCKATSDKETNEIIPNIDHYAIDGEWKGYENYIYGVEWSRFGNVEMKKWVVKYQVDEDEDNEKGVIGGEWVSR